MWLLLILVAFGCNMVNVVGYTKCKKDARKAQQRETRVASLDAHAARLLAKANGDVDQAQNAHFEAGLRALQENEPALFAQVVELQRTTPADIDSEGAAHAKRRR